MLHRVASAFTFLFLTLPFSLLAAPAVEYRAFWAETFNTPLGTRAEIDRAVEIADSAGANALFVQVRRRGDAWYLDAREPLTEVPGVGEPDITTGRPTLDPLQYLIEQAHARGIEVHAFTIVGSIYRDDPRVQLPRDPRHVFLQHVWDASANAPYDDARQWATRALPHNPGDTSYGGRRFGREWYIDLGHPDAAAYTVDVLAHLVRQYDLDGLHLDRVRYPEGPVDRRRSGYGANVGYNDVSVARFNARYGRSGVPATNDPQWNDWRRDQVTSFVRRLYLTVKAIRPELKVSAALITFGSGPKASGGFEDTESYLRVFQDWQRWAEEGILDLLMPMDYKRESVAVQARQFDDWLQFTVDAAQSSGRHSLIGVGSYLNTVDGTLRQSRRARRAGADGVVYYSLARTTPELISTLRTVHFTRAALAPDLPPVATGALMGIARDAEGQPLDGVQVTIAPESKQQHRALYTDGNGFFGATRLQPGRYSVTVGETTCNAIVAVGRVTGVRCD